MAALMRNVCFCPTRATPNAIYSWPWMFVVSIWPLANPGVSVLFKVKAMNKECCINIKESPNCLRNKISYRIATSQLFSDLHSYLWGNSPSAKSGSQASDSAATLLLNIFIAPHISLECAAFRGKVKPQKTPACCLQETHFLVTGEQ